MVDRVSFERWLPVPGYENLYEVSDLGRVKSVARLVRHNYGGLKLVPAKIIGCQQSSGYVKVILRSKGVKRNFNVHQLVLLAFVGPVPEGCVSLHGPKGEFDHSLNNLSYGTQKQNLADQDRDGVLRHGENHGCHKLTGAQVIEIYDRSFKESYEQLAKEFKVTRTQIYAIHHGITWSRITGVKRG